MGKLSGVWALLGALALTACTSEEAEARGDAGVADAATDAAQQEGGRDAGLAR